MDSLCRRGATDKVVETAFRCVDRANFVESEDRESGYLDALIDHGIGAASVHLISMSQQLKH